MPRKVQKLKRPTKHSEQSLVCIKSEKLTLSNCVVLPAGDLHHWPSLALHPSFSLLALHTAFSSQHCTLYITIHSTTPRQTVLHWYPSSTPHASVTTCSLPTSLWYKYMLVFSLSWYFGLTCFLDDQNWLECTLSWWIGLTCFWMIRTCWNAR